MTLTLQEADTRAREILDALGPHCGRIETTGEIRRRCPTVERIEVVLIPGDPMEIQHFIMRGAGHIELFGSHIARVEMLDHTRINFHFAHDDQSTPYHGYPCNWGSVQLFVTGPKGYTDSVRRRATQMRCFWNVDHGLFNTDGVCIASATEEEILSRGGRSGFPWPLKQNGDPREKAGRQFYQMWKRFDALPKAEKEKHRLGGGCEVIRMKGVRADAK